MKKYTPQEITAFFPIIGLVKHTGGIIIRRNCILEEWGKKHVHERKKITRVTSRSLNRLALLVRSSKIQFTTLMTLTYGQNYPLSGRIAKKHLNCFLTDLRRKFGKFDYFWVVEFQGRGAIHFHMATTLPEPTFAEREIFADTWARISQPMGWEYCRLKDKTFDGLDAKTYRTDLAAWDVHLHPKAWEKVKTDDGMERYITRYANKIQQKTIPEHFQNVGRFWGVSKGVTLGDGLPFYGTEAEIRTALAIQGRDVTTWQVLPKVVLVG